MCGLVGVFGDIKFNEEKAFKTLLALDVIRGKHSTGVAGMSFAGYRVAKAGLNAIDFMDLKEFGDVMKPINKCLMGHNRFATVGAINDQNAHPFEFEHIIGAHNGSLQGGWKSFHNGAQAAVDSEALYSEMNENGVDTLWGKLQGAAALTWIDKRDKTLNFLRNSQRPLFYVTANKGKTLLWASEDWMLYVAGGREGVVLDGKPHELTVNTHITFKLPEKFDGVVTSSSRKVEPYVPPKPVYNQEYYNGSGNYSRDTDSPAVGLKKHQEKEGVSPGGIVDFTVDMIRDYVSSGTNKCNIIATTVQGTPVRIMAMDAEYYNDILGKMEMLVEGVFSGRVTGEISTGLTIAHATISLAAESMGEYIMQLDEGDEEEALEQKRDVPVEQETQQFNRQESLKEAVVINMEIDCADCMKKTRAYHLIEGKRYCLACAKTKMH